MATPFEIVPGSRVWFGSADQTHIPEQLRRFTHVVNCESCFTSSSNAAQMRHFLFLRSYDQENFPILATHFPTLLRYITYALTDPRAEVYLHCYAGINRSAALAIAYACHLTGRPAATLIQETREATGRLVVENVGFYQQLTTRWPVPTPTPESSIDEQSAAP